MATILVIDDTEAVRSLFRTIIERAGHAVVEAVSGHEGIRLFKESPTDAVITDMHMPDGGGLEVIRELRVARPDVRILAVSGADGEDLILSVARLLGADGILLKPFGVEDLVTALSEILNVG